jgi:hypothetical protein
MVKFEMPLAQRAGEALLELYATHGQGGLSSRQFTQLGTRPECPRWNAKGASCGLAHNRAGAYVSEGLSYLRRRGYTITRDGHQWFIRPPALS